jgi:ERCC4-type nuclease
MIIAITMLICVLYVFGVTMYSLEHKPHNRAVDGAFIAAGVFWGLVIIQVVT